MKKRTLLILLLSALFLVTAIVSCNKFIVFLNTVETSENISDTESLPDWLTYLPDSAKNISYWKRPLYCTAFEYEVNEEDILNWAKENEIQLDPIEGSVEIFRYLKYSTSYPDKDDPDGWDEYNSKTKATVSEGYEFQVVQDNGGGSHILYDSKNKKAYHFYSFR